VQINVRISREPLKKDNLARKSPKLPCILVQAVQERLQRPDAAELPLPPARHRECETRINLFCASFAIMLHKVANRP
jgi:hypothetical protein